MKRLILAALLVLVLCTPSYAAEAIVRGTPARFQGALKIRRVVNAPTSVPDGFLYVYVKTDGLLYAMTSDEVEFRLAPGLKTYYSSTAASAAHTGATAAATAVMPASADGTATIAVNDLRAGNVFQYFVLVEFDGDADGDETLTATVNFGSQAVGTSGAVAVDEAGIIILTGTVKILTVGASGTGVYYGSAAGADYGDTFSSFATTSTKAFSVTLDWGGTTDADDTATVTDATLLLTSAD